MEAGVTVYDGDKVVLSTSSWFGKLSDEPPLMHESWNGKWELTKRREDWNSYLSFLGVPEAAHEMAIKAPDFHEYKMSSSNFFMDHKIPAQNMHLRFTAAFEDSYQPCPSSCVLSMTPLLRSNTSDQASGWDTLNKLNKKSNRQH